MKLSSFITMLSFSLCATLCCPEDEETRTIFVENENLIRIQNNQNIFNLNDNIVIETEISNNQISGINEDIQLTDFFYNDDLESSFLQYTLTLYKQTGFGTLSKITVTNQDIITESGAIEPNGQNIEVKNFYDESTNSFKSRFSINLQESGTFFLSNTRLIFDDSRQIRISGGIYELGYIEITTSIQNANTEGAYMFEVIE